MKKVYVVIAVLLVALFSTSYVIGASQEGNGNVNSDQITVQNNNETLPGNNVTGQAEEKERYMFVQTAQSGSLVPVEREENLYTLTLEGVSPQTIAFSDRPERVVDQVPMQQFLDGLGFSPEDPPNAAIEILGGDEGEDVMVMALLDPVYDAANQTLQYNVSILEEPNHSYAIFNERHDKTLPEKFAGIALFIDDCPPYISVMCYKGLYGPCCGQYTLGGCCWDSDLGCTPCNTDYDYYVRQCKEKFGDDCNEPDASCASHGDG